MAAEQGTESVRGQWWNRMSVMVQGHTGRPLKDDARRFDGSSAARDRAAICDALTDAYAGDFRHQGLVRGLARQVAVRDVDDLIANSDVPAAYAEILDQRGGEPEPADVRDRLREAAAASFAESIGDHLGDRRPAADIARSMLATSPDPGPQTSPLRTTATALFSASRDARAMIPREQHQNAITDIQQAMENHVGEIEVSAQDLTGHSGLPPREYEQTLLETQLAASEIADFGIEAVERLAHPSAPTGKPLQAATVDLQAAQQAASAGLASAAEAPTGGAGRPDSAPPDPRLAYRVDQTQRSDSREV